MAGGACLDALPGCFVRHGRYGTARHIAGICTLGESVTRRTPRVGKYGEGTRQWMAALTLFAACIGNAYLLMPSALVYKQWSQQVQSDIHGLPAGPIVSWADSFPFEFAFPVLANDLNSRNIRFYGLDSFTLAPFSVASTEQKAGRGMLERLRTATGISIIASPKRLEMLRIYCREHLNGQLRGVCNVPDSVANGSAGTMRGSRVKLHNCLIFVIKL